MENAEKEIIDYISNIVITEDISDKEVFYNFLKQTLGDLILRTVDKCYFLVQEHPLTDAYVIHKGDFQEPETLKEYQKVLGNVKAAADRVKKNIKAYGQPEVMPGVELSKFATMRNQISQYVTQLIYFVNAAIHLQECANTKPNDVYLREVLKALPAMENSLKKLEESVDGWNLFGQGYDKLYFEALEFFLASSRVIFDCAKNVQEAEKKKLAEEEAKKPKFEYRQGKKVESVQSLAEQERKAWVKKTNDLFDELCLDFMRDLEKQYSMSSKDMYENFVNVKFKKFVETFKMPLAESTSIGQAKEAYGQIRKLMEYISTISENSYTVSVYSNNE